MNSPSSQTDQPRSSLTALSPNSLPPLLPSGTCKNSCRPLPCTEAVGQLEILPRGAAHHTTFAAGSSPAGDARQTRWLSGLLTPRRGWVEVKPVWESACEEGLCVECTSGHFPVQPSPSPSSRKPESFTASSPCLLTPSWGRGVLLPPSTETRRSSRSRSVGAVLRPAFWHLFRGGDDDELQGKKGEGAGREPIRRGSNSRLRPRLPARTAHPVGACRRGRPFMFLLSSCAPNGLVVHSRDQSTVYDQEGG